MDHQLIVLFHLLCAVLFVGAVAMEVLILEPVRKFIGDETFQRVEFYLFRRIRRTYPLAVIPLYITGFYMYFGFVDSLGGFEAFIDTRFGQLLTLKMSLALGLLTIFATSPMFSCASVRAASAATSSTFSSSLVALRISVSTVSRPCITLPWAWASVSSLSPS